MRLATVLRVPNMAPRNKQFYICDGLVLPGSGKDIRPEYGVTEMETNSVTARAEDGTIEAIEKDNIVAVQRHPEVDQDMAFFEAFVRKYL